MKKLVTLILVLAGIVGTASAATETTVYYAVPSNVVGTYTVKLNVNRQGDGDDWYSYVMTNTGKTFLDNEIYECTFTDLYNGLGCIQFQLYDEDTWKSQEQVFGTKVWTSVDVYNGKMYVYGTGSNNWIEYTYDRTTIVHCKKNGEWIPSKVFAFYDDKNTTLNYNAQNADWPGEDASQNSFMSDYYDFVIDNKTYNYIIFDNGNSGQGTNQTYDIPLGDASEYWIVEGASSATATSVAPEDWMKYTRPVTSGNFGTICLPYDATVTGATLYTIESAVKSSGNLIAINLSEAASLTGGVAYIFQATSSELVATCFGSEKGATAANHMMGNLSADNLSVPQGMYVVGGNEIHKVTGDGVTVGQYRGYLNLADLEETSARGAYFISLEGETTGIDAVKQEVKANEVFFNLAGQRVAQPAKGLYIVNGKKVIMK